VEKYCRARQVTDDDIVGRRHFASWIHKATDIDSKFLIFIAFSGEQMLGASVSVLGLYVIACLVFCVSTFACNSCSKEKSLN